MSSAEIYKKRHYGKLSISRKLISVTVLEKKTIKCFFYTTWDQRHVCVSCLV